MSLIVFPFKSEDIAVFRKNICEAAFHLRVDAVLCVGYEENKCYKEIEAVIPDIEKESNKEIRLILQERLGDKRPGKGDGMNTALRYFLEETDYGRLHFYDSDIKTFTKSWIADAEEAADLGYQIVRHYFPRSCTDAMVTWMITKTGFALLWPNTELPYVEQPLGGELLMTREVAERLSKDETVINQSDWGIDTVYTWSMVNHGFSLYETYQPAGKIHRLYGTLTDLKEMVIECFSTIQSLKNRTLDSKMMDHKVERGAPVPDEVKQKIGYNIEGTIHLLMQRWTDEQVKLLNLFADEIKEPLLECQKRPRFDFMNKDRWRQAYKITLEQFDPQDEDWRELLFKLWITRVLNYTTSVALKGYDQAMYYLYQMIEDLVRLSKR
ncbi:hypothetical protein M1O56_04950 [Dehalococcoidia bacterium]|nr:hypothetical protein [Dehalococcoidia bacterium]